MNYPIFPIHHLPDKISVGVQTEKDVSAIGFDLRPWLDAFPGMSFSVWPKRPGEKDAYPAQDVLLVGTVLYWHPDGYDTALGGDGTVEIVGVSDTQRKSSGAIATVVRASSLVSTKEPGEDVPPWYAEIIKAAENIAAGSDDMGGRSFYIITQLPSSDGRGNKADRTVEEINAAIDAGKICLLMSVPNRIYIYVGRMNGKPTFISPGEYDYTTGLAYRYAQVSDNGYVSTGGWNPAKTPSPYKLAITGAVKAEYDGSKAVFVELLPLPADASSAAYLRWNGTKYTAATIDDLKADLGLT